MSCFKCDLCYNRTNIVLGEGVTNAKIMFIGEAPGYKEDKIGRPFVGKSGVLLRTLIEYFKLSKYSYITNTIKCQPPRNRNPFDIEIDNCYPYLEKEIEIINPILIVTVGAVASSLFKSGSMKLIGGVPYMAMNRIIVPIYHPSYVLRNIEVAEEYVNQFQLLYKITKILKSLNHI